MFLSAALAEQQAHAIARRPSKRGQEAYGLAHDRCMTPIATARRFAEEAPATPPPPTP